MLVSNVFAYGHVDYNMVVLPKFVAIICGPTMSFQLCEIEDVGRKNPKELSAVVVHILLLQ